jgi:hypothetical protein
MCPTRVVHNNIQCIAKIAGGLRGALNIAGFGYITHNPDAVIAQLSCHILRGGRIYIRDGDTRTLGDETRGNCGAKSRCTPCNQSGFPS